MRLKKYILSFILMAPIIFPSRLFAQEKLTGLSYNPVVHQYLAQHVKSKKSAKSAQVTSSSLSLPFFEDFSVISVVPDTAKWTDDYVFINSTFCINPASIGVATFDALDANGDFYGTDTLEVFSADTLTSRPISLNYTNDDSICFSFKYQPGGYGLTPQGTDTFFLEFYAPNEGIWHQIWKASYDEEDSLVNEYFVWNDSVSSVWKPGNGYTPNQLFRNIMVPLRKKADTAAFLHDGFRFRFRSMASLSLDDSYPGNIGNTSIWNLDYVYLDRGRDTAVKTTEDVAITQPMASLLSEYESMPWQHFLNNYDNAFTGYVSMTYRNNGLLTRNVSRGYKIFDTKKSKWYTKSPDTENIDPDSTITYSNELISDVFDQTDVSDSSELFTIKSYIKVDEADKFLVNDTVRYNQVFSDYYSYDDGTAEMGYGVTGNGAEYGSIAIKYHCYNTTDSLLAVRICFNKTYQDTNTTQNFYLAVWDNNEGVPGNLLYYKNYDHLTQPDSLYYPISDGTNTFATYYLYPAIIVPSDYYVGWVQTVDDYLNVGFDMNRDNSANTFYNTDGYWYSSGYSGTVMLRPVFGKQITRPTSVTTQASLEGITIYPNPCSDKLYISVPESMANNGISCTIYNVSGQIMLATSGNSGYIDVSGLPGGFYIVRIMDKTGTSVSKKIIVAH